jgi:hypothetical protein
MRSNQKFKNKKKSNPEIEEDILDLIHSVLGEPPWSDGVIDLDASNQI